MCRRILLSLSILGAAFGAYWLRTQQLSVSGLYSLLLWALLAAALLLSALLLISERGGTKLSQCQAPFIALALQGGGALLIAVSAVWRLYLLYPAFRSFAALTAIWLLLGGLGLLGGMFACGSDQSNAGSFLLLSLSAVALQLLSVYWESSVDPDLRFHDMRILFLCAAAFSIAFLNDFAFFHGKRRLTLLFLALTVILAGAALPGTRGLPGAFAVAGTALAALGFFLALLFGFETQAAVTYELVEDPFHTGRIRSVTPGEAEDLPSESAEASPPPQPTSAEHGDDFDLGRVDRLLLELDLESDGRKKR